MKKLLLILIIIGLITADVYVTKEIKRLEQHLSELDYTVYEIPKKGVHYSPEEPIILSFINAQDKDATLFTYKYYKKLNLTAFCGCDTCAQKWKWPEPPKWKQLKKGVVAANPNTLSLGDYVRINEDYYIVYFVDESIPTDSLYVYVKLHADIKAGWCSGIYDVYKAK